MYNQDLLILKIRNAQGSNSLNDFARASNVDAGYLSRILNKKKINPPSPEILRKIANASHGTTTYEELMIICGYLGSPNTALYDFASDNDKKIINNIIVYVFTHKLNEPNITKEPYINNLLEQLDSTPSDSVLNLITNEIARARLIYGIKYTSNIESKEKIEDNSYFRVMQTAKEKGFSPEDMFMAMDFLERARKRDKKDEN